MTTLSTSNTYKNHTASTPVGCIMQYLGTSDPDGWIICDGQRRSVSDGRFSELCTMIGGTSNSVTPPDLRGKILYGASSTTTNIGATGGSATIQLSNDNLPSHNHSISISDPGHNHSIGMSQDAHSHTISVSDPAHSHTINISQSAHSHTNTITDPGHGHNITASQTAHQHPINLYDPGHEHQQQAYLHGEGALGGGQDGGVYKASSYNNSSLVQTNGTGSEFTGIRLGIREIAAPAISASVNSAVTNITSTDTDSQQPAVSMNIKSSSTGISASSNSQQPGIDASSTASSTGISASSASAGSGNSLNIMPAYYTVNFIMKI